MELHPIIGWRPEIGLGKRPAPIERDAIVWARTSQDKTIIHADRGKSARQDRLGAGVVIHEFVSPAVAICGRALDQVVDANHHASIGQRTGVDNTHALARAFDRDSGGEKGTLVSGDGETRRTSEHLMVSGWGRRGR